MILMTLFVIASLLDLGLTIYALNIGMVEAHPIAAAMGYRRLAIFKLATNGAAVGLYAVGYEALGFSEMWTQIWRGLVVLVWLVVFVNAVQIAAAKVVQ